MVDVRTAEHHGVCPTCEGYCGNWEQDGCPNELCVGSCPACRCPGCQDGWVGDPSRARDFDIPPEEYPGSWPAYLAVQETKAHETLAGQETLDV